METINNRGVEKPDYGNNYIERDIKERTIIKQNNKTSFIIICVSVE